MINSFESLMGLPVLLGYIFFFALGAIIGSFLNVVIYRVPNECCNLSRAKRIVRRFPAFRLPEMRQEYQFLRQYSDFKLARFGRKMPPLQKRDCAALSGSRAFNRTIFCSRVLANRL